MFKRNLKSHDEVKLININIVLGRRNNRGANKLILAHSLFLVVDELQARKEEGRIVTHAMNSTPKKLDSLLWLGSTLAMSPPSLFPSS